MESKELIELGFEYIKFTEPSQSCGIDVYHGYDYYIKKIGVKTDLILRKKGDKVKVEGFYCSAIKNKNQLLSLIDLLS